MRMLNAFLPRICVVVVLPVVLAVISISAWAQTRYVVTNDDAVFPFPNGVSFFTESANGTLKLKGQVDTRSYGIGGGFFGANRVIAASDGTQPCVYMSQAFNGVITGVAVNDMSLGGTASGSFSDTGASNGIGLAVQGGYLYASFTDDSTIATFSIQTGCSLMFLNDTPVVGLNSGVINAMATNGSLMVVSFTDGSIESFNIANGTPVSNGDAQLSTATVESQDATYPNQIVITSDGQFAIFGDTSTSVVLEVANISAGTLSPTLVYASAKSISSSNIVLSPDETVLYTVDTQGATVSAFSFNKTSGTLTYGCTSGVIRGQSENWSYLANAAVVGSTGNGGGVYVAEFGTTSGIALVNYITSNGTCSLQENTASPFLDPNSTALLSIATATTQ